MEHYITKRVFQCFWCWRIADQTSSLSLSFSLLLWNLPLFQCFSTAGGTCHDLAMNEHWSQPLPVCLPDCLLDSFFWFYLLFPFPFEVVCARVLRARTATATATATFCLGYVFLLFFSNSHPNPAATTMASLQCSGTHQVDERQREREREKGEQSRWEQ